MRMAGKVAMITGGGAYVHNPPRSHPAVEAVLGEKTYKVRAEDSPDRQKLEISKLQQQVEHLTELLGAKVQSDRGDRGGTVSRGRIP